MSIGESRNRPTFRIGKRDWCRHFALGGAYSALRASRVRAIDSPARSHSRRWWSGVAARLGECSLVEPAMCNVPLGFITHLAKMATEPQASFIGEGCTHRDPKIDMSFGALSEGRVTTQLEKDDHLMSRFQLNQRDPTLT